MFEAAERGSRVGKWIFGTCVKGRSRAFGPSLGYLRALLGTKFWKVLKKICRHQSRKLGFLETSAGAQKPLKPLQKPLMWGIVKKF